MMKWGRNCDNEVENKGNNELKIKIKRSWKKSY
jgi:hypothetical protein